MGRAGGERVIDRGIRNRIVAGASPARPAAAGSREPQEFEGTVTQGGLIRLHAWRIAGRRTGRGALEDGKK